MLRDVLWNAEWSIWWSLWAEGKSLLHSNQYCASCVGFSASLTSYRSCQRLGLGFFSDLNKVIVCLWAFDLNRFSSFYDDDNTPKLASSTEASVYIILAPGDKCTGGGGSGGECNSLTISAAGSAVFWINLFHMFCGFLSVGVREEEGSRIKCFLLYNMLIKRIDTVLLMPDLQRQRHLPFPGGPRDGPSGHSLGWTMMPRSLCQTVMGFTESLRATQGGNLA